jgi:hypothetical protein
LGKLTKRKSITHAIASTLQHDNYLIYTDKKSGAETVCRIEERMYGQWPIKESGRFIVMNCRFPIDMRTELARWVLDRCIVVCVAANPEKSSEKINK